MGLRALRVQVWSINCSGLDFEKIFLRKISADFSIGFESLIVKKVKVDRVECWRIIKTCQRARIRRQRRLCRWWSSSSWWGSRCGRLRCQLTRIFQCLSICCCYFHFYSFSDDDLVTEFIATGTFCGFCIILTAVMAGKRARRRFYEREFLRKTLNTKRLDSRLPHEGADQQAHHALLQPPRDCFVHHIWCLHHPVVGASIPDKNPRPGDDKGRRVDHQRRDLLHGHDIHVPAEEVAITVRIFLLRGDSRHLHPKSPAIRIQSHILESTRECGDSVKWES